MKSANWEPCSEASINSELKHLREVRANLSECVANLLVDEARPHMTMALSFVQSAIDALAMYQVKIPTVATAKGQMPNANDEIPRAENPSVTLSGTVQKIIPSPYADEPEKAQIAVEGADRLYRELRVENALEDEQGKTVALKLGAEVAVTIEANPVGTAKPNESKYNAIPDARP